MWSKIDDAFPSHPKVQIAGDHISKGNGQALAIALYVVGLAWSNKFLTDGRIPKAIVRSFPQFRDPERVAEGLVSAKLWTEAGDGYLIHDFFDFNFSRRDIEAQRKHDRERKRNGGRSRHGIPHGLRRES